MTSLADHFTNLVIRASAGTGKTFQLSNRYIGLVAADEPADTILATTFTRKAAGEILDRVLYRLAEAALDNDKLADLRAHVGDPTLDQAKVRELLGRMIHALHRLRVSTLDSFFIQLARSFSLELGLPPGWQVTDETTDARMRAEAIRNVLQDESTGDVVRLMHLLTKGEATRSVTEQIGSLVTMLHSLYQEAPTEAWQRLKRPKPLTPPEVEEALSRLAEVELPVDKRFTNARQKDLDAAERGDWQTFIQKGIAAKVLNGDDQYCRKPLTIELVDAYETLLAHAKAVLIGQIAGQTEATQGLLRRFDNAYVQLKIARRALRFEDVTRRLTDYAGLDAIDRVAYRLDANVSHLLLDEFQDTAPSQWNVLRPFAQDVTGEDSDRSLFCVGDVKQAIYGWRGGVAEIFDVLDTELGRLSHDDLDTSYRSCQTVIDTVNRIFGPLAENPTLAKHAKAASHWAKGFHEHKTARTELLGQCRMTTAPMAAEGVKQDHETLRHAAGEVARLHAEAPGRSIGVLVRRNASVARIIHLLRTEHDVEASEEGGNPLTDSPAVQLVLSLLTLADHPGDRAARFHVARSPLGPAVGLTSHEDGQTACDIAFRIRSQLMDQGYGTTLHAWVGHLADYCDHRDLSRLMQLVELAHAYEPQATNRADDFVHFVSHQRMEDPSSADVRVMTVHQSKGLQFDIVVLPELDVKLTGQSPAVVAGRPSPTATVERICRYVNKETRTLLPQSYQQMFEDYATKDVEESLCVLYVAITRAIHALEVIIAPSKSNEKSTPSTMAGLLRAVLTDGTLVDAKAVLFEDGRSDWHQKTPNQIATKSTPDEAPEQAPLTVRLAKPARKATRGLDRRSPSQLEGGPRIDLAGRMRLDSGALDWGTAMHALFEQIEWLDGWDMDDDRLTQVVHDAVGDRVAAEVVVREFRRALQRPGIREVLSQTTYRQLPSPASESAVHADAHMRSPRWEVLRERPFGIQQEDAILRGSIDRLVVLFEGPQPIAADILDYKTDAVAADDPAALESRVEIYRPQLEAYRQAVAELYSLDPTRITTRLVFVKLGQVVSV